MKKRLVAFLLVLVILIPCAASAAGWYRLTEKKRLFNLPDYDSLLNRQLCAIENRDYHSSSRSGSMS